MITRAMKIFALVLTILFVGINSMASETINLVTYYPVPFGAYDRIKLVPRDTLTEPCDIGTVYAMSNGRLQYCVDGGGGSGSWSNVQPGVWQQSGNDIFPADTATNPDIYVGIGTESPESKLHVADSVSGGYAEIRLDNTADQSGSQIVFEEGGQGNNFIIRYNSMIDGSQNWLEFWGLNAPNGPIMTLLRDEDPAESEYQTVGIGVPSEYLGSSRLEVRNRGTEDILNLYDNTSEVMTVIDGGNVGIGVASPARILHLNGPMRINTSAAPSSPADGDIYSDGTALYYYDGSAWKDLTAGSGSGNVINYSQVWDAPNCSSNEHLLTNFTIAGVADGDPVAVGHTAYYPTRGTFLLAWATAANTVTVMINCDDSDYNMPSGTLKLTIFK